MKSQKLLVSFVALMAFAVLLVSSVHAETSFVTDLRVTVNGIESFGSSSSAAVFAGETIPVRVIFTAAKNADDVRIRARIAGGSASDVSTERFDVVAGGQYSQLVNIKVPFDLDERNEGYVLEITVEGDVRTGDETHFQVAATRDISLEVQRESYLVQVLSADSPDQIEAGKILPLDIVLKNRGRQIAEDTYVRATILELGVSNTVYFGDLTPTDDFDNLDKEDAVQRRMYLTIPKNAAAGIYTIQLEAYNSDSSTTTSKRFVVVSGGQESQVLSPVMSKTFAVGAEQAYTITVVNSGDQIKVYDVIVEAPKGLTVEADQSLVVVPAGSSKTVTLTAKAAEEGNYNFVVNVNSNGELIQKQTLAATVQGTATKINSSVVLTVVLAVIFIVLVIVLIVLLTRKPQKTEEFGESYY